MKLPPLATSTASLKSCPIFVYGTLRATEVMSILLDKAPQSYLSSKTYMESNPGVNTNLIRNDQEKNINLKAFLPNFTIYPVKNQRYPAIIPSTDNTDNHTNGVYGELWHVTEEDIKILDWYEEESYKRELLPINIICNSDQNSRSSPESNTLTTSVDTVEAFVYIWCDDSNKLDFSEKGKWDYSLFLSEYLDDYIQDTVIPSRDSWNSIHEK
jgi:gamma-glutamylcyclotransferase (GGCT)/AIG2-like uncharacterized protein YtfP